MRCSIGPQVGLEAQLFKVSPLGTLHYILDLQVTRLPRKLLRKFEAAIQTRLVKAVSS